MKSPYHRSGPSPVCHMPAGNTELNPGILLVTHKMAEVLKEAKAKYDLVFIDGDSITASKDALELAGAVEAAGH